MGVGKTYWGRKWSAASGLPFYDLDDMTEKYMNQSVSDCFHSNGELAFRKIESDVLRSTSVIENAIIACGGGTPCFHHNLEWMNENGKLVYIKASPLFIKKQIQSDVKKRPLIQNLSEVELLSFIDQKLKERSSFYEKSTIQVMAEEINTDTINQWLIKNY